MEEKPSEDIPQQANSTKPATRKPRPLIPRKSPRRVRPLSPKTNIVEDMSSSSDDVGDDSASDQIPPFTKRRKVLTPPRAVNPARPVRTRVMRHAAPPTRQQAKSRDASSVPSRTSSRLNPSSSTITPAPLLTAHSSQSGFSSSNDLPPDRQARLGGKNPTKKK